MSRFAPAFAVALLALPACASHGAAPLPQAPAVAGAAQAADAPRVGALQIEPREIVYTRRRRKGVEQPVRVWQRGYDGEYSAKSRCYGVTVRLRKYTEHDGTIWNVGAGQSRVESCVIVFTGSGGPRGTNSLHISILR